LRLMLICCSSLLPPPSRGRKVIRVENGKSFSIIYSAIAIALAAGLLIAMAVTGQFYWSITLTFLSVACIVSEWQVIRLPQGDSLTLSTIFILLALVFRFEETTPIRQAVGALEVIAIGSLVGYGMARGHSVLRLGFYVAHHILTTTAAGAMFVLLSGRLPYGPLESFHLAGVAGYVIVLSILSTLLIGPINRRIIKGEKLPKSEILYTIFLAPIALIVYYLFDTRELDIVSLIILALPLIGVLVTFGLYVNIDTTYGEVNQLYHISQEFVSAMSQEETVQKASESISKALSELILRVDACLIYAHQAEANEYLLANLNGTPQGPQSVMPGHGLLGRTAVGATGAIINDLTLEDALSPEERQWPAKTAILVHPMFAEQQNIGLLVLIRHGKGFTAEEFRLVSIVANQAGVTLHNAQMFEQSIQMADTDRQLGILNQAAFVQQAQRILGRARIANQSVALLYGDIDDFRKVNNTHGHQTGDRVLAGFARLWENGAGALGIACRWGGEELAILLPDSDEQQALAAAEAIRRDVQDHEFESVDGQPVLVTISIGVSLFPRDAEDIVNLVKFADRAQYLAKRSGKNRVCLYEDRKEAIGMGTKVQALVASAMIQE
jgi:diguanylate cyclase (GGDEF)-like protein